MYYENQKEYARDIIKHMESINTFLCGSEGIEPSESILQEASDLIKELLYSIDVCTEQFDIMQDHAFASPEYVLIPHQLWKQASVTFRDINKGKESICSPIEDI